MQTACMGTHIHIRDFEDDLHAVLLERAKSRNLSLTQYLKGELSAIARRPDAADFANRLRNLPREAENSKWAGQRTARMIREMREERGEYLFNVSRRDRTDAK
jgi:hypothetical protein